MAVFFHEEKIRSNLKERRKVKTWIKNAISREGKAEGQISVIFTTDKYLLEVNKKYLSRDYYTDIITFNYSDKNKVSGDLYISSERVMDNAREFNVSYDEELLRVIIHGILHLLGYGDKSGSEIEIMRKKEDQYLDAYGNNG